MFKFSKEALLVFGLLAFIYGYFYQDPGWNGNSRLGLTLAMVQEGRLTIDSFHTMNGITTGDKSLANGHYYTDKAIGSSLLAAIIYLPIYWVMQLIGISMKIWTLKHVLTFLVIGLPSALTGSLIYILGRFISKSRFRSLVVTLAIMLGTMFFPYSVVFIGHPLVAALLVYAFYLIFKLRFTPGAPKIWQPVLIGFMLGMAFITEYPTAAVILALIGYYLFVVIKKGLTRRISSFVVPAIGVLIPLGILLIYNTLAFGNLIAVSYALESDPTFSAGMAHGFMGIGWPSIQVLYYETIHPAQGLFWQSPVLIMALVGAYFMYRSRQYRAELWVTVFAFLALLLINSGYYMWWGGYSFGVRNVIPMLPFLSLPLLFVPRRIFPLAIILGVLSIAQMLIVSASVILVPDGFVAQLSHWRFFQYSTIYSVGWPRLLEGNFGWNVGDAWLGLKRWISLIPIALAIFGPGVFFYFRERKETSGLNPAASPAMGNHS